MNYDHNCDNFDYDHDELIKRPWVNLEVGGWGSLSVEGRRGEARCFGDDHPAQHDLGGDRPSEDGVGEDDIGDVCGDQLFCLTSSSSSE